MTARDLGRRARFALTHPGLALATRGRSVARIWGSTDYTPFIVLARSRTGSNLLVSMLNSHPHTFARGEVFRHSNGVSPQVMVENLFSPYPRRVEALGCKVFYYHPLDGSSEELWSALNGVPDLRVIHLRRRNILRTIVSRRLANRTGAWSSRRPTRNVDKRLTLAADELEAEFSQTRLWETEAVESFRSHGYLEVCYEELVDSPEREFRRVVGFLGVSYRSPKSAFRKQNPEPLSSLIANYAELKEHFAGTPWTSFFTD